MTESNTETLSREQMQGDLHNQRLNNMAQAQNQAMNTAHMRKSSGTVDTEGAADADADADEEVEEEEEDEDQQSGPGSTNWNIIKNPFNGRTRISQACDRCRARKIKCSGKSEANPRCTNCEKDGFPCVVSDKLTRNSFPKGYTKNLEKKLLDVELSRNQLVIELNNLKKKLASYESSKNGGNTLNQFNNAPSTTTFAEVMRQDSNNGEMTIDQNMLNTLAYGCDQAMSSNVENNKGEILTKHEDNVDFEMTDSYTQSTDNGAQYRKNHYYNKKTATNDSGILVLDQNLVSPFETIFSSLKSKTFKGYTNGNYGFQRQTGTSVSSGTSSNGESSKYGSCKSRENSYIKEDLNPLALKQLTNYHMNLNRFLNLILYKLIFPLFNLDSNTSGLESNKNLDHLIWLFFNDYNKLIPILDFELFYNDYLNFVNTYTLKTSTYSDNGEIKKRYYEFNTKDQDTLIKIILVLKFTLCQPKINEEDTSSAFLPDKTSLNQLDESLKLINIKHIIFLFKNINFALHPNLDKLEISLLLFYYLIKYENYNLPNYTDSLHSHKEFLMDVININRNLVYSLNINKSSKLLVADLDSSKKSLVEIQRLKLYWNFKILIKLTEIYFNIPLVADVYEMSSNESDPSKPLSLESILLVNKDISITLCLVKLLKIIPWNVMELINLKNVDALKKIDDDLSEWRSTAEQLYNEETTVVFNKLKSYYLYFKVLVNINGKIDSSYFVDFVNLVYNLTFDNPKAPKKSTEISIEAAESLCLHSFNFHLVTLIALTSLQYAKDKVLCQKIYKLIQLYQILINYKDVDPLITVFVSYIKDNIMLSFADINTVQDDTLKLFSSLDASKINSKSLFDKKVPYRRAKAASFSNTTNAAPPATSKGQNQNGFDLNAFTLSTNPLYSNDDLSMNKRRRSNESAMSFLSSNVSVMSRDSSIASSSRRLSGSSNDSAPSIFASATSPHHNPPTSTNDITSSAKKRIMDYVFQPSRAQNRNRSFSNDSKLRSSRVSERRPSNPHNSVGGFQISRENSLDPMSKSLGDHLTDDEMISQILQSDMDSETDSDISTLATGRARTNFKPNTDLLPTIPSEGNLTKIMESLSPSIIEPLKKAVSTHANNSVSNDFDIDSLFSPADNALLSSAESSGFSKAFKKSPESINGSQESPNSKIENYDILKSVQSNSNILGPKTPMIDNEDLMRLKEHVMNLKSSAQ